MSFKVVIPARYGSTRLPGKMLADIGGKPMIRWVAELAERSQAAEVIVATDHPAIVDAISGAVRARSVMTRADHASGTDRVAEVVAMRGWSDDIVVNVQGDEPRLPHALIDQVARLLANDTTAQMATLCTPITSLEEFCDPNVVKVVTSDAGAALYFSRAPIPWSRDSAQDLHSQKECPLAQRHLGIYAYRAAALRKLTNLPVSSLERVEKLEQLRALQAGIRIAVAVACEPPGPGVDTASDLDRVRAAR